MAFVNLSFSSPGFLPSSISLADPSRHFSPVLPALRSYLILHGSRASNNRTRRQDSEVIRYSPLLRSPATTVIERKRARAHTSHKRRARCIYPPPRFPCAFSLRRIVSKPSAIQLRHGRNCSVLLRNGGETCISHAYAETIYLPGLSRYFSTVAATKLH